MSDRTARIAWLVGLAAVVSLAVAAVSGSRTPGSIALGTVLQSVGLAVVARFVVTHPAFGPPRPWAWGGPSPWLGAAALAGVATAVGSHAFAEVLSHWADDGHVRAVSGWLSEGGAGPVALAVAFTAAAPVGEELLFRGALWEAVDDGRRPWLAWLVTTLAFAAWHGDPLQAAALLPVSAVFGLVRLRGGVVAAVAAHAVHNGVAVGWLSDAPSVSGVAAASVATVLAALAFAAPSGRR